MDGSNTRGGCASRAEQMNLKRAAGRLVRKLSGDTLMVRSLERELILRRQSLSLFLSPGSKILDIGANNALYRSPFPQATFHTLDVEAQHQPDIVADVHELNRVIPESSYDAILCTEVLEPTRTPIVVVAEMCKALKPGGVLLASSPFIIPYHPDHQDFWRMIAEGWSILVEHFSHIEIVSRGN